MTEVLTVSEAARVLNVSGQTLRKWADDGKIPMQRTEGGQRIFMRADVEKMEQARRVGDRG